MAIATALKICNDYTPFSLFEAYNEHLFETFNEHLDELLNIENPILKRVTKGGIFVGATIVGLLATLVATIVALVALPILAIKALYHSVKEKLANESQEQEYQNDELEGVRSWIGISLVALIPIYGPAAAYLAYRDDE